MNTRQKLATCIAVGGMALTGMLANNADGAFTIGDALKKVQSAHSAHAPQPRTSGTAAVATTGTAATTGVSLAEMTSTGTDNFVVSGTTYMWNSGTSIADMTARYAQDTPQAFAKRVSDACGDSPSVRAAYLKQVVDTYNRAVRAIKIKAARTSDLDAHNYAMKVLENNEIGKRDMQTLLDHNTFDYQPRPFPQAVTTGTAVEK